MTIIRTTEELEALYGPPGETSLVKEIDRRLRAGTTLAGRGEFSVVHATERP